MNRGRIAGHRGRLALALTGLCGLLACGGGEAAGPAPASWLHVAGAQRVVGPLPEAGGGPEILTLELRVDEVAPGQAGVEVLGRAAAGTYAVALGLGGDAGHYVTPVGLESPVVPNTFDFSAVLAFGLDLPRVPQTLRVQARDTQGRPGPVTVRALPVRTDAPPAPLEIALAWDRIADVDLVVTTPTGLTLDPTRIATRPGEGPLGGIDRDAVAGCVPQGRQEEALRFTTEPTPGAYQVYARLASACGEGRVSLRALALRHGTVGGRAEGVLYPEDARRTGFPDAPPGLWLMEVRVAP
ncbi:MAG: hypothetical protein KA712_02085 [Myxococcales bacterium]|nr:hypothetical protein [Myxococcales bacterium]